MKKSEFIRAANAPRSIAQAAWEAADGDEEKARELLEPDKINVKGRLADTENGFYGLFCFRWHLDSSSPSQIQQIVLGDSDVQDVSTSDSLKNFQKTIENFRSEGGSMGGFTDELQQVLKSNLSDRNSQLYEVFAEQDLESLEDVLDDLLRSELEMDTLSLTVETELERKVAGESNRSRKSREPDTQANGNPLKGNVEINPVRGVPISNINPGDQIFVRLRDSGSARGVREFENADGLIPAQLLSKGANAAGKLRLKVEFPNGESGTLTCGKDVSIVVPDSTKEQISTDSSGNLPGIFQDEIFLGTAIAIIILIVIGIWMFL